MLLQFEEMVHIGEPYRIMCPDCGEVEVRCDVFDKGRGISGECPSCEMRLYFADSVVCEIEGYMASAPMDV